MLPKLRLAALVLTLACLAGCGAHDNGLHEGTAKAATPKTARSTP
jgi:hypothetical protein